MAEILTATQVVEFKGHSRVRAVIAKDVKSGKMREFHPAGVFVFVGLTPNTSFLGGAVALDGAGFIQTDDNFQTSMPGVFAAGDVRDGSTKQVAGAVGEGTTALLMVRQTGSDRFDREAPGPHISRSDDLRNCSSKPRFFVACLR